jgi:E-phenylitaconyl-CoA hydratase
LVNKVTPLDAVVDTALDYARRIGENAPLALQAAKELAIRSRDMDLTTGLRMEQLVNRILHQSQDTKTAKQAFAEKRKPKFEGK